MENYLMIIFTGLLALFSFMLFVVSCWQSTIIKKQLSHTKESNKANIFLSLVQFIKDPERARARKTLICLKDKPVNEWTDDEKDDANMACGTWDSVGLILMHSKIVDHQIVTSAWHDAITRCWENGQKYLEYIQKEQGRKDPWDGFLWLYERTKNTSKK